MHKQLTKSIRTLWHDLLDVLFPRYCAVCDRQLSSQEEGICLDCLLRLHRTQFHTVEHSPLEKLFWGNKASDRIVRAVAFFYYNDVNKSILLEIKYNDNPELGRHIARFYASEIADSSFFEGIDLMVPVPLHRIRKMRRGYNQSEYICRGISEATHIPICTKAVRRVVNNVSQTRMQRTQRHDNVNNIFRTVHPEMLNGKHILIVDDVCTTGSTINSLITEILTKTDCKVSILVLAYADMSEAPVSEAAPMPSKSITDKEIKQL